MSRPPGGSFFLVKRNKPPARLARGIKGLGVLANPFQMFQLLLPRIGNSTAPRGRAFERPIRF